ncbi:hypothetical protein [Candidatus Raskinella chloraquaticus]|uniref:Uncharacterized protein n=1 Tax=Candidatus Raskinella chloraquaticus TaxID=1951219 RepID=A0A1W9HY35_9HYPH|nr:MAG: hypothetical protein A4S15_08745 [Proteobacteria bacterium SG_bin8]
MTSSTINVFDRFSVNSTKPDVTDKPLPAFVRALIAAFETSGRLHAMAYFARKTDLELAQLGLTRASIFERLKA